MTGVEFGRRMRLGWLLLIVASCHGSLVLSPNDGGSPSDGALANSASVDASADDPAASDGAQATDGSPDRSDGCESQQVAAPTFSPPPGPFPTCVGGVNFPRPVTLTTTTPNASIYYTTDGTQPGPTSPRYESPIELVGGVIQAYAVAPCMEPSAVVEGTYTFIACCLLGPALEVPPPGTHGSAFDVSLTAVTFGETPLGGGALCYTLNGSTATCDSQDALCTNGSQVYDPAVEISIDPSVTDPATGKVTLNTAECAVGFDCVAMGYPAVYTLQLDPVAFAPAAGTTVPAGGTLSGVQITESGASTDQPYAHICWSTDGTTVPDCACAGATPENAPALVGPGLYVSSDNATPVMQVQQAPGASGITVMAVGCALGYAPSDAPYATITWN